MRKPPVGLHAGFSLLELLVTITLIAALASLVVPCWGMITRSRAKQAATSLVMDSLERARHSAIAKKNDVWVVFQHQESLTQDSLRLVIKQDGVIIPLDGWQPLPNGISFECNSASLMKQSPPEEILSSIVPDESSKKGATFGSLLFQRSGRVGVPMPGGVPLVLLLNSPSNPAPISIMLSRATGRATTKER